MQPAQHFTDQMMPDSNQSSQMIFDNFNLNLYCLSCILMCLFPHHMCDRHAHVLECLCSCDSELFPQPPFKGLFLICVTCVFMSLCPSFDVCICVYTFMWCVCVCVCACPCTVKLVALLPDVYQDCSRTLPVRTKDTNLHMHT